LLASLASSSIGCVGLGDIVAPRRTLPGGYEVVRTEGPYIVAKAGQAPRFDQSNLLLGEVTSLGWTDRHLVARRQSGGSKGWSGWIILDVQRGEMKGPLTDAEFKQTQDRDLALREVKVLSMEDAWKELSRR
jgi:hypothetical protein